MTTDVLRRAAEMGFDDYDPGRVLAAADALRPLGRDAALRRVEQALGDGGPETGLFWVLRVVFDVPAGESFPPVRLGRPSVEPPSDPGLLPRFPIVLAADVPILAVRGYDLGGLAEPVRAHVDWFRAHGRIRQAPLAPRPAAAAAAFGQAWAAAYGEPDFAGASALAREQIERMGG